MKNDSSFPGTAPERPPNKETLPRGHGTEESQSPTSDLTSTGFPAKVASHSSVLPAMKGNAESPAGRDNNLRHGPSNPMIFLDVKIG